MSDASEAPAAGDAHQETDAVPAEAADPTTPTRAAITPTVERPA